MPQQSIPFMQFRGGSSKGIYLLAADLPQDAVKREEVILDIVGRDAMQIDGLGGGAPVTSKVAVVSPSSVDGVDVDYLFVQVVVGENRVDTMPNCGNILAAVGPFALETGLIKATEDSKTVSVRMLNSNKVCELLCQTPGGEITYAGDTRIDGVPGSAAPVICSYTDIAGSVTGALLPTSRVRDSVDGIDVTCIDNGMPVVVINAADLDISGHESPEELDANEGLKTRLESIRLQIGSQMNLGDVTGAAIPKMCLVSSPTKGGLINTRTFIPYKCHKSVGVLGAVTVATACLLPGSVAEPLANVSSEEIHMIEHPSGAMEVQLELQKGPPQEIVKRAGVVRTARLLSKGKVFFA